MSNLTHKSKTVSYLDIILRPYGRAADPVAILIEFFDRIVEARFARKIEVRFLREREKERKRERARERKREREKEKYFHKGSTPTPKRRSF